MFVFFNLDPHELVKYISNKIINIVLVNDEFLKKI